MSKIGILIKNEIRIFSNRLGKMSKRKKQGAGLILALLLLLIVGSFSFQAYENLKILQGTGAERMVIDQQIMTLCLFSVLFIISNGMSLNEKDSEFLMSLPIKKRDIIVSKTLFRYLFDLIIAFVFLMPVVILYLSMVEFKFSILIYSLVVILLLTFAVVAVEYMVNAFVNGIAVKFKHFNVIKTVLSMIAVVGFIVCYSLYSDDMIDVSGGAPRYVLFSQITDIIIDGKIINLLILAGSSLLMFGIGVYLFSLLYGKKHKSFKTKNKVLKESTSKTLFGSMIKKEFKMYFNSTVYLLNTGIGYIILMAAPVVLFFIEMPEEMMQLIVYAISAFSLSTCSTSASSLSLEGKNIWIYKSAPINCKKVIYSKAMMNFILVAVSSVVATALMLASNTLSPLFCILMMLLILASGLVVSFVGIVSNLLFPKLDFENETAVVKNSASVGLSMLLFMIVFMVCPAIYFVLLMKNIYVNLNLLVVCNIAFLLLMTGLAILFIEKKAEKIIHKL